MNREIKFRAWDKQYKKISNVNMILFSTKEIDTDDNNGEPKNIDHYELMHNTGLKDKNGKEIYEGDIVKFKSTTSKSIEIIYEGEKLIAYKPNYNIAVILFYKTAFGLHNSINTEDHESSFYNGTTHYGSLQSASYDIEVIGNIYENPELLIK